MTPRIDTDAPAALRPDAVVLMLLWRRRDARFWTERATVAPDGQW